MIAAARMIAARLPATQMVAARCLQVRNTFVWITNQLSLALHFISVYTTFSIIYVSCEEPKIGHGSLW
jgi:hypothetical protein